MFISLVQTSQLRKATVNDVKLNDEYICVVMEGKARLHRIINSDSYPSVTFPEQSRNSKLLAAALSNHFLILSSEASYLVFFSIAEWCVVSEYRHTSPIRQIHPDADGLRTAILDERTDTWIYSPVDDSMHKLPAIGSAVHYKSALWKTFTIDRDTFVVFDNTNVYVYLLNRIDRGHTPAKIHAIRGVMALVLSGYELRRVTGNKIFRILKANGMAPEKYRLILVESRIHRLARYYKTSRQLPATWKYESATAASLIS
ncbi:hypothetical protein RB195_012116 [Necator americanus]|uniref:WDR19 WD40 repeat domain-containing protein n=1 Tax=Necator americanus TaxID=51031 RepID=A0ABR1D6V1_NECAM